MARGGFGPPFSLQITANTPRIFLVHVTSLKNTRRANPRWKGGMKEWKRGEGDGLPHPIYHGYYTILVLFLNILGRTT
jgi:hypothetical protein